MKLIDVRDMKFIHVDFIQVSADKGTAVGDCIRECIILASTEWRNVRLIHNEKMYKICPMELFASVGEGEGRPI